MPRTPRRALSTGIYLDRHSLTARVTVHGVAYEQTFPRDATLKEMQLWRNQERVRRLEDNPTGERHTLDADVAAYLKRMEKRPASLQSKRSELKAWCARLGSKSRHRITGADIDAAITAWTKAKVAPKTIVNRCRTLRHLFGTLANNKRARTPFDAIDLPAVPKRRPVSVDVERIKAVEIALRKGDAKDRGRFMVLAATGIRPSQLMRVQRADVDLTAGLVITDGGKGGEPIVFALNSEMVAAWTVFVEADAFGDYDTSRLSKICRKAGWPDGVRVYNAKHSVGIELSELGAEADDIRQWFGHVDQSTTRIYTGAPLARMRRLSAQLEGRLGWAPTRNER